MHVTVPLRLSSRVRVPGPQVSLVTVLVAVGLGLRVVHFLANHTIWYDESVLLWNILDKSYLGLLGPLEYAVAAPPLFTFLLKSIAVLLGDSPMAWRAVPMLCSCGTLLLTPALVRRVLPANLVPVAVAMVAISDSHIWLGCTIKPYAGDCLVATGLWLYFVATVEWPIARRLRWLAIAAPVLICWSFSAVFLLGGMLVAMIPTAWTERKRAWWLAAAGSVAATFALLYIGPISAQRVPGLVLEWEREFLPWRNPLAVPGWLVEHTASVFQYNALPTGFVLAFLAPIGTVAAWRTGKRELVAALVTSFALAVLASSVKSYPYGFNRLMHFAAPGALLLGMLGLAAIFEKLANRPRIRAGIVFAFLAAMAGPTGYHLIHPWDRPDSSGVAKYVREHREPGDLVASNEGGYAYFFRGELRSLSEVAVEARPGDRIWVPMDHYTPEAREKYVAAHLAPGKLTLVSHVVFKQASVFLWVKQP